MKIPRKKTVERQSNSNHLLFQKNDDNAVFFSMESNQLSVPRETHSIRIDLKLHVKLFYESKTGVAQLILNLSKIPYCERFTLTAQTSEAL